MNDLDLISSQTNIADMVLIERVYIEQNKSIPDTIMKLMNYEYCKTFEMKPRTVFDDIRVIVDEKEQLFYDILNRQKEQRVTVTEL